MNAFTCCRQAFKIFLCIAAVVFVQMESKAESDLQEGLLAFQSVKRVKLLINQQYEGKYIPILKNEDVSEWFRVAGVRLVPHKSQEYDGVVTISVDGTALSQEYFGAGFFQDKRQYSGAMVTGSITFRIAGGVKSVKFSGRVDPPMSISKKYPTTSDAPFREAFFSSDSFGGKIGHLMVQCYGREVLVDALKSEDPRVRRGAVETLGELRDAGTVGTLITVLQSDIDHLVRRAAVEALGKIGDVRALEPLIAALKDHGWVRVGAAVALKNITRQDFGDDHDKWKAWWEQKRGPRDEDTPQTFQSVKRVKIVIDQQYEGQSMTILKKEDVTKWLRIADVNVVPDDSRDYDGELMIKVQGKALSQEYNGGIRHYSGAKVDGVIRFAGSGGPQYALFWGTTGPSLMISKRYPTAEDAPFSEALFKSDCFLGKMAFLIAQCYGPDVLLEGLKVEDEHLRKGAAEALGDMRYRHAVELLITILHEETDLFVRRAAVDALGRIGDDRAVEPLILALRERGWIQNGASEALKSITSQDFGKDYDKWRAWCEQKHEPKLEEKHSPFHFVKRVKIVIDQEYEGERRRILEEETVEEWLRIAGVEVIPNGSQEYDAELRVKIRGKAVSQEYSPIAGTTGAKNRQYSGASVDCIITFTSPEERKYTKFSARKNPPTIISNSYPAPKNAPFVEPLLRADSFPGKFAILMGECFGQDVLLEGLKAHEDWHVGRGAVEALGEIGDANAVEPLVATLAEEPLFPGGMADREWKIAVAKAIGKIRDPVGVEGLISLLGDRNGEVRGSAIRALVKITGQKFDSDQDKWKAWWVQNKERILSGR